MEHLDGVRVAITGGTSGSGTRARGRTDAPVARECIRRSDSRARRRGGTRASARLRHRGDVARKEDIYPIALQIAGNLGGLDVADQQAFQPRTRAARAAGRHRVRGAGAGAGDERARTVRSDQGAAGALTASAREGAVASCSRVERCRGECLSAVGRIRPSKAALRHMSASGTRELAVEGVRFPVALIRAT